MNICPLTYEPCGLKKYSPKGLAGLDKRLQELRDFPYSAEEQRLEAAARSVKMSIQGVQPKLSVILDIKAQNFSIVDSNGLYILKPQHLLYPGLPQNEDLSMHLATLVGIEVPWHGLIYASDGSLSYVIKRFDRSAKYKIAVEDFAQLAGKNRETKYDYSMEGLIDIIEKYCTFPALEKARLFKRTIFNFLIGNEDMHLKNFSLITHNEKTELAPAYDLVDTTIVMPNAPQVEEMALTLAGKRRKITRALLCDYYAAERMHLPSKVIKNILKNMELLFCAGEKLIAQSFLTAQKKALYLELLHDRRKILGLC